MDPAAATDRWTLHDPDPARRAALDARMEGWRQAEVARRLWARDVSLWSPPDQATAEAIGDRLGWLDLPQDSAQSERLMPLREAAQAARDAGVERLLVAGMGGSSLAPEVFQRVFGAAAGAPRLEVLDSTHPAAVAASLERHPPASSWYVVASKSGTTQETMSFFRSAWAMVADELNAPGERFLAVTDPGTPLAELAEERGFRQLFLAPPDVGGRYSALSPFGLAPAALIGVDVAGLLERAREMADNAGADVPAPFCPPLLLGGALGELARAGRTMLTLLTSPGLRALPDWMEQLIAESLGKDGRGIVPIVGERPQAPASYADNRVICQLLLAGEDPPLSQESVAELLAAGHPVMRIILRDPLDLGAEMLRWEMAVASAGIVMDVQPFDQPNVELAKRLARQAMAGDGEPSAGGSDEGTPNAAAPDDSARADEAADDGAREITVDAETADAGARALLDWLDDAGEQDYVALMAFLQPSPPVERGTDALRRAIAGAGRWATTFGWGPRFLHSTGQLHKGGPDGLRALQLLDRPEHERPVPESDYSYRQLLRAQADGDLRALRQSGREVLRVHLRGDPAAALAALGEALSAT